MKGKAKCKWCRVWIKKDNLNKHLQSKTHEFNRFRRYEFRFDGERCCPICQHRFTAKGMTAHASQQHRGKKVVLDPKLTPAENAYRKSRNKNEWFNLHHGVPMKQGGKG